ncbi:hypothetical protein Pst134EA_013326 [Puccinia striiformis f. sp. tritici]|uniref:hypothetical protein n=1 Tax=Puccinia striiformis f. sp. tritici TaxID=168172 RepID=UPI00200884CE|nr:hypothetical protein Pst134EA_013326 [Puccinia striiformis f. sp. tritici]KAH9465442.1 hypothetical protein Pst134EA_013326 [Puccinia striiformis f. sp. tritici]
MAVPMGYSWIKMAVLAVLCLRATQCMDKPLLGKGRSADWGKSPATAVSIEDVAKHSSGSVFRDDQVMKRPAVSQVDTEQYFKSIREFSKPSHGLSIDHLNHIAASGNPYWSAVHINSLGEDFEIMSGDLDKLAKAIRNRKLPKDDWREEEAHKVNNDRLLRISQALQTVRDFLQEYIERTLSDWASENKVPKPKIFSDKFLSLKKKTSGAQERELKISAGNMKSLFPKDRLEDALSKLSDWFYLLNRDKDRDFQALHRIYIQTVDQAYKHNMLESKYFKNLIKTDGYASVAARNMFLHFTSSAKNYKNPLFRDSDILLELWYSSPFVNMLKVIDNSPQKAEFLYEIIRADALNFIGTPRHGWVESPAGRSFKGLF